MNVQDTHVLLVDYQQHTLNKFDHIFLQHGAITHHCHDRIDAMGKLWELVKEGITPRAIVTNWILQDERARAFYKAIKREVDMTSHNLLKNAIKMDPQYKTILICYTEDPKEATVTLNASGLLDRVVVVNMNNTTVEELAQILMRDERIKIVEYFRQEVQTDTFKRAMVETLPISGAIEIDE